MFVLIVRIFVSQSNTIASIMKNEKNNDGYGEKINVRVDDTMKEKIGKLSDKKSKEMKMKVKPAAVVRYLISSHPEYLEA